MHLGPLSVSRRRLRSFRGPFPAEEKSGPPADDEIYQGARQASLFPEDEKKGGAKTPAKPRFPRDDNPSDEEWNPL